MTAKPSLAASLWAMTVALVIAVAASMLGRVIPAHGVAPAPGEATR